MKLFMLTLFSICAIQTLNLYAQKSKNPIKVLIVDGQNTHEDWPKNTYILEQYLEETGLFDVAVARTQFTWKGEEFLEKYKINGMEATIALEEPTTDPNFNPDFSKYDVVVANYGWKTAPWPQKTINAFESFVKNGGGFVVFHAANNAFPDWKAQNEMTGIGRWGDRTEKDGPYVYYDKKGKGKVFHSVLGHADYSIACIGFKTYFLRGTEWAATGKVTQKVPDNFPSEDTSSALNLE